MQNDPFPRRPLRRLLFACALTAAVVGAGVPTAAAADSLRTTPPDTTPATTPDTTPVTTPDTVPNGGGDDSDDILLVQLLDPDKNDRFDEDVLLDDEANGISIRPAYLLGLDIAEVTQARQPTDVRVDRLRIMRFSDPGLDLTHDVIGTDAEVPFDHDRLDRRPCRFRKIFLRRGRGAPNHRQDEQ